MVNRNSDLLIFDYGDIVEVIHITNEITKKNFLGRSLTSNPLQIADKQSLIQSINRSKRKVKRYLLANIEEESKDSLKPYSKFVTLTFKKPVYLFEDAFQELKNFIRRTNKVMKKLNNTHLKYLAIIHWHSDKRRLHIHLIAFNLTREIEVKIRKIWDKGIVHMASIKNDYTSIMKVTNYICREFMEIRKKYPNMKLFSTSRGLNGPIITINKYLPYFYRLHFDLYMESNKLQVLVKKKRYNKIFELTLTALRHVFPMKKKGKRIRKKRRKAQMSKRFNKNGVLQKINNTGKEKNVE